MIRYVLLLLMITTFCQSFGIPVVSKAHFVTYSLKNLAKNCGNQFLADHINNRTDNCSVVAPPYHEKQLLCLMFYDINSQLCAAASQLSLNANSTAKISDENNINEVCYNVKDWIFTNLTDYPLYKGMVEKYLRPVTCGKICGTDDIVSEQVNFVCKYFNWGNILLKNLTKANDTASSVESNDIAAAPLETDPVPEKKVDLLSTTGQNQADKDIKVNYQPTIPNNDAIATTSIRNNASVKSELLKQEPTLAKVLSDLTPVATDKHNATEKHNDIGLTENKLEVHSDVHSPNTPSSLLVEKTIIEDTSKPSAKASPVGAPELQSSSDVAHKDTVLDTSNLKPLIDGDPYSYPDDESKGVLDGQGGDDEDDQANPDPAQEPNKIADKNIVPVNGDMSQKIIPDYYPNSIQEGFSDDDDHFFPFFLTVVILVVLLYVLYHNKSKVSKVFLGLIFEGRQGSRRRNSRGHAYRRLDTLEQAMTNKATAPPSKIIY